MDPLLFRTQKVRKHPKYITKQNYLDQDVVDEEARVRTQTSPDHIHCSNLTKIYPNGYQALSGISFGVKKKEIFGLLGPNGAGPLFFLHDSE